MTWTSDEALGHPTWTSDEALVEMTISWSDKAHFKADRRGPVRLRVCWSVSRPLRQHSAASRRVCVCLCLCLCLCVCVCVSVCVCACVCLDGEPSSV
jgi:hypothetical protein